MILTRRFSRGPTYAVSLRDDDRPSAALDRTLARLPARVGGFGLLLHAACSPHAYAAAAEASDIVVHSILSWPAGTGLGRAGGKL